MGIAVKFGINTTLVVLEMVNFQYISNTTLVVFIPNFTATHAITSTNRANQEGTNWLIKVLQKTIGKLRKQFCRYT